MTIREQFNKFKGLLGISLSFAKANFKLRNEGSYLGIIWYLLEPILFLIILLAIRGVTGQGGIGYYPVYLFLGLIMYNFFMNVTTNSTNSIQSKSKFVKNMILQRESLVLSTSFQFVFSHMFELIILIALMIFYNVPLINILFYPLIFVVFFAFTIGTSLILATIGVFVNDLKNVWAVFSRILWFATPIFYAINSKGLISIINYINPLTHFLNISRDIIIYGRTPNLEGTLLLILISVVIFGVGIFIFGRYKSRFAEEV